ncbi:hypothetical protein ACA910_022185 [Epithemia clementina (nom. ined.)]
MGRLEQTSRPLTTIHSTSSSNEETPIDLTEVERVEMSSDRNDESNEGSATPTPDHWNQPSIISGSEYPLPEIVIPRTRKRKIEKKWKGTFFETDSVDGSDDRASSRQDILDDPSGNSEQKTRDEEEDTESESPRTSVVSNLESEITTDVAKFESKLMPKLVKMLDHGCAWIEGYDCGLGPSAFFGNGMTRPRRSPNRQKVLITGDETDSAIRRHISLSFMDKDAKNDEASEADLQVLHNPSLGSTMERTGSFERTEWNHDAERSEYTNGESDMPDEQSQIDGSYQSSYLEDNSLIALGNETSPNTSEQKSALWSSPDRGEARESLSVASEPKPRQDNVEMSRNSISRANSNPTSNSKRDNGKEHNLASQTTNSVKKLEQRIPTSQVISPLSSNFEFERSGRVDQVQQFPKAHEQRIQTSQVVSPLSTNSELERPRVEQDRVEQGQPPMLPPLSHLHYHASSSAKSAVTVELKDDEKSDKPLFAPKPHLETDVRSSDNRPGNDQATTITTEDGEIYSLNSTLLSTLSTADGAESDGAVLSSPMSSAASYRGESNTRARERQTAVRESRDFASHPATVVKRDNSQQNETIDLTEYSEKSIDRSDLDDCASPYHRSHITTKPSRQISRDPSPKQRGVLSLQHSSLKKKAQPKDPEGRSRGCGGPEAATAKTRRPEPRLSNVAIDRGPNMKKPDPSAMRIANRADDRLDVIDLTTTTESDWNKQRLPKREMVEGPKTHEGTDRPSVLQVEQQFATFNLVEEKRLAFLRAAEDARTRASILRQERMKREKSTRTAS